LTRSVVLLLLLSSLGWTQRKVDPRNTYQRLICVVPVTGAGTAADPKRPMYAPATTATASARQSGIIGYSQQLSDDGRYALVEFVARDRSAFAPILADKSIKAFVRGEAKRSDIETEFRRYKSTFDFEKFGLVMP
jgi:hypothetical protein